MHLEVLTGDTAAGLSYLEKTRFNSGSGASSPALGLLAIRRLGIVPTTGFGSQVLSPGQVRLHVSPRHRPRRPRGPRHPTTRLLLAAIFLGQLSNKLAWLTDSGPPTSSSSSLLLGCCGFEAASGDRALRPGSDPALRPDSPHGQGSERLSHLLPRPAAEAMANPGQGGVPLDEWRKDTPPGWKPGIESYPLKLFFSKLKLWYRCCEVADEIVGPLIAGRLQGGAQRLALELKLVRPDGGYDIGDAALVRLSVDEVIDPNDGVTIIQHHIPSGVQALCNALRDTYGDNDETQAMRSLENFFEYKRPHGQSLQEYSADWELRYEEAKLKSGLDLGQVAKSYLWMKQSGLPQKHQDDLRLQVQGDMSRFHEIRALAVRLSHRVDKVTTSGDVFYGEYENDDYEDGDDWYGWTEAEDYDYWSDAWWTDGQWSGEDLYGNQSWYEDEQEFYEAEELPWQGDPASEPGYQGEDQSTSAPSSVEPEGVFSAGGGRGKGHGSGSGCFICGSKWHLAADCPVKGKGKGSSSSSSFGGKSKGKYRKGKNKGKGKGKGKHKGRPTKGRGKSWTKGSWSSPDGPRSWLPRYYVYGDSVGQGEEEEWESHQQRHVRTGLHLGDSPPKDPPNPVPMRPARYFDISDKTTTAGRSDYFEDLLSLERTGRPTTSTAATATVETSETSPADTATPAKNLSFYFKKLAFFFRSKEDSAPAQHQSYHETEDGNEIFHTVGGRRRRGLIIDPGAANGLVGTETLRDLLADVDKAQQVKDALEWKHKESEVTGISGAADTTLGEIKMSLPMIPGLEESHYKADVIGGNASMCPALVGNPSLVNMKAVLASNWFENKDGLLIIPKDDDDFHMIRLLLTDSKHYLLPLDGEASAEDEKEKVKAKTFLSSVQEKSKAQWKDVRSWFTWTTCPKQKRSHFTEDEQPAPPPTTTATASNEIKEDSGASLEFQCGPRHSAPDLICDAVSDH